jgi:TonB family protein
MKNLISLVPISVLASCLPAAAGNFKVIANFSVKTDSVTTQELHSVFLEERSSLRDGSHVEPVVTRGGTAHEDFLREILGFSEDSLQSYYRALVFTGRGSMPKEFNSDEEVTAYVTRTKGALGYVSVTSSSNGAKTLAILRDGVKPERALLFRAEPKYPDTLQRQDIYISGTVRLQITVSPQGTVEDVILLAGNPTLGEAASRAVRQWVYASAPYQTTIQVTIPFTSPW